MIILVNCSNCGADVGDSKVCPECGAAISVETQKKSCPKCGKSFEIDMKFCPYCAWSSSKTLVDSNVDRVFGLDDKVSGKVGNVLKKSKAVDAVLDKSGAIEYKFNAGKDIPEVTRKYFEKVEPVFLEFIDAIDDLFVKSILVYERFNLASGGDVVSAAAAQVFTPTRGMAHDDAINFYKNMLDDILRDINQEKQNGTFDEEEFYKKRVKKSSLENITLVGVPKSVKHWKNNR